MAKRRSIILFMFAVAIAAGAAWVANNWLLNRMAPSANTATLPVLTAKVNIGPKTQITKEHLRYIKMPPNLIPATAIRDPNLVLGKFTTQSIFPGELLFQGRFVDNIEKPSIKQVATLVQPDLRAVAVAVDSVIGMGTFVAPGTKVDVLASREGVNNRLTRKPAAITTIVQDVQVLSVDQTSLPDGDDPLMKVRAVTLQVSPYQAEILAAAGQKWKLTIAIRPVQS